MEYVYLVYNITNTIHLLADLREIPCSNNLCFASFYISNMYTNIPTNQIPDIIRILCNQQNIESNLQSEIMRLCQVVLTQNYFSFRSSTDLQMTGLALGAPTSPLFFRNIPAIFGRHTLFHDFNTT